MKIKLDENLGERLAQIFRQAGHDVTTVSGQGLCGVEDRSLAKICGQEQRCLVSLDMDFSNPFVFDPRKYFGIAVLRVPTRSSLENLLDLGRTLIRGLSQDTIEGKLWIVQRDTIREYRPESDLE